MARWHNSPLCGPLAILLDGANCLEGWLALVAGVLLGLISLPDTCGTPSPAPTHGSSSLPLGLQSCKGPCAGDMAVGL